MKHFKHCMRCLLVFLACSVQFGLSQPSTWLESDWNKFIESAVAISIGEAYAVAGAAFPITEVYAALGAMGGATKVGLQKWLSAKIADAYTSEDFERADHYELYYACLTWGGNPCIALQERDRASLEANSNQASSVRLNVDATFVSAGSWMNTGIDVEQGTFLDIQAEGEWRLGEGDRLSNATGLANFPAYEGFLYGTLLGRIGEDGEAFKVGTSFSGVINATGRLYLANNDENTGDNSGALLVTIRGTF